MCLDDLIFCQQILACIRATSSPWQSMPPMPLVRSTALVINGALLAVGESSEAQTELYSLLLYQPSNKSWVKAGELPTGQSHCSCTVLLSGDLYVAGGGVLEDSAAQSTVDIASIHDISMHKLNHA